MTYDFLTHIVSLPVKKKKKIVSDEKPNQGTIERFFKKKNATSSSNDSKKLEPQTIIDKSSQPQQSTTNAKSTDGDEIKQNYVKCSICGNLLPKVNLFIHQIRCYKK